MTLLTVRQAAERLQISAALVYGLCAQRRLRHERYGLGRGRIRIPEDALDEFRRSVTVAPKEHRMTFHAQMPIKLKHITLKPEPGRKVGP